MEDRNALRLQLVLDLLGAPRQAVPGTACGACVFGWLYRKDPPRRQHVGHAPPASNLLGEDRVLYDYLSKGRFILGAGIGWTVEAFEALGANFNLSVFIMILLTAERHVQSGYTFFVTGTRRGS